VGPARKRSPPSHPPPGTGADLTPQSGDSAARAFPPTAAARPPCTAGLAGRPVASRGEGHPAGGGRGAVASRRASLRSSRCLRRRGRRPHGAPRRPPPNRTRADLVDTGPHQPITTTPTLPPRSGPPHHRSATGLTSPLRNRDALLAVLRPLPGTRRLSALSVATSSPWSVDGHEKRLMSSPVPPVRALDRFLIGVGAPDRGRAEARLPPTR
jgi:hypothetical protein